jgi:hypothetical protein
MTSAAHLHPKLLDKSRRGGLSTVAQRWPMDAVRYCERCLDGRETVCQHGRRRCEEKLLWQGYLAWRAEQRREVMAVAV